jgi:hypothetical protein
LSLKIKVDDFLRFGLKTWGDGFPGLGLKTGSSGLVIFASKSLRWVSRFGPQNWQLWFGDLGHRITATVSSFGPQNHAGFSLSVAPQN